MEGLRETIWYRGAELAGTLAGTAVGAVKATGRAMVLPSYIRTSLRTPRGRESRVVVDDATDLERAIVKIHREGAASKTDDRITQDEALHRASLQYQAVREALNLAVEKNYLTEEAAEIIIGKAAVAALDGVDIYDAVSKAPAAPVVEDKEEDSWFVNTMQDLESHINNISNEGPSEKDDRITRVEALHRARLQYHAAQNTVNQYGIPAAGIVMVSQAYMDLKDLVDGTLFSALTPPLDTWQPVEDFKRVSIPFAISLGYEVARQGARLLKRGEESTTE